MCEPAKANVSVVSRSGEHGCAPGWDGGGGPHGGQRRHRVLCVLSPRRAFAQL